ncbi:MAG TPA: M56 family metallopeptidase [Bryobacteraceae bacterium]|nr:M56 family metallopeptidase [Bryobacteraceae bacterium]
MIEIANHLWQSTLFAILVAALTRLLRSSQAQARHWLWTAASLKFLLPFSLLASLGGALAWHPSASVTQVRPVAAAVSQASELLIPLPAAPMATGTNWLSAVLLAAWSMGLLWTAGTWAKNWRQLGRARREASLISTAAAVPVLETALLLEPGVFGIWRPVLLLPRGIVRQLPDCQLQAILAHELCHVRRRDNLWAAVHMVVTAVFWFHPLVWWIAGRLEEERELACDEEVIRQGYAPVDYAEGILNVCAFYLQSPLPCASGVTGADLKGRVRRIMSDYSARRLTLGRKAILAGVLATAAVLPILVGVVQAQGPLAFDVVSIRPSNPGEINARFHIVPGGGLNVVNIPVRQLIEFAYGLRESQLAGGPAWISRSNYDIIGRLDNGTDTGDFRTMSDPQRHNMELQIRQRTQALLMDRFGFRFHREQRELPILALVTTKGGPKMKVAEPGGTSLPNIRMSPSSLTAQRIPMSQLAETLSRHTRKTVVDQTHLSGDFDIELQWTPDGAADGDRPSLFTAIQEQLGLRLEAKKGMVDVVVIEKIEKPAEN